MTHATCHQLRLTWLTQLRSQIDLIGAHQPDGRRTLSTSQNGGSARGYPVGLASLAARS